MTSLSNYSTTSKRDAIVTQKPSTMGLYKFISNIWAGFSPPAPKRRRTPIPIDEDTIEPINHWYPGNRTQKKPRRLVETPTAGHWPEYRVAKKAVGKGRKRCNACGALLKKESTATDRKKGVGKSQKPVVRNLRGRVVECTN